MEPVMIASQDPASTVAHAHKLVVNCLTANTHSIQIPHLLSEGTGTLKAVFTDHSEVGCGLWRGSCWLPWFQTSSGCLPQEDAINGFSGHTNPSSNVALTHALMGQRIYFSIPVPSMKDGELLRKSMKIRNFSETAKTRPLKVPWNGQ